MVQINFDPDEDWPEFYYPLAIDAGIVPTVSREEFRITLDDWMNASGEDLDSLNGIPLYDNQEVRVGKEFSTGDTVVHIRYHTPCITSLGRV